MESSCPLRWGICCWLATFVVVASGCAKPAPSVPEPYSRPLLGDGPEGCEGVVKTPGHDWGMVMEDFAEKTWMVEIDNLSRKVTFSIPVVEFDIAGRWDAVQRFRRCNQREASTLQAFRFSEEREALAGRARQECHRTMEHRVVVEMPRWTGYEDAGPEVQSQWDAYVGSVGRHELGHVLIALRARAQIQRAADTIDCGQPFDYDESAARLDYVPQREYDQCTCGGGCQDTCESAGELFRGVTVR